MKKFFVLVLTVAAVLSSFSFVACGEKKPVVGIIQFGSHGSLNTCYEGIIKGLEETIDLDEYTVEYVNSNFDAAVSASQASKMVSKKAKVILAIATPSAIQAATGASGKDVPVVYCAVTDASNMNNFSNVTGTSDIPDFDAQLNLVTAFLGKEDVKIGVLTSTEESSDPAQLASLQSAATAHKGMTIEQSAVTSTEIATIDVKISGLIAKGIDCFVNLLDNTVVGKLDNILTLANQAGIPVFGSEIEQVKNGCLASASIDYLTVGRLAGRQAAEILGGKKADEVEKQTMENQTLPYYNSAVLSSFPSLVLPSGIEGLQDVQSLLSLAD